MDAQQRPPDRPERPNTLGQAWRRMADSRSSPPRPPDLPTLPDWPPLPGEQPSPSAWPSLGLARPNAPNVPDVPDESHPADALQPTERDAMRWQGRSRSRWPDAAPAPALTRLGRAGILRRLGQFRRTSRRARIGLAAAAVVLIVLVVACSSFALRATAGLVTTDAASGAHGAANQSSTASVLATVTPHPTSQPTQTSAPLPPLTLAFTCASGKIRGTGQVCVHTLPGAALSLTVRYCDGSTAKGLHGSATADGSGNYTWSWPVRPTCPGSATATVTAKANGQSLTASDTFTITA
jgi:hypothetical protein